MTIEERVQELESIMQMAGLATKEVLTFDEAALYMNFSKSALYRCTSLRMIPHYKPTGKMIYFNRRELEDWLQKNKVKTMEEIQQEAQSYCMRK